MEIVETGFEDLLIIEPRVFSDSRGYFLESYRQDFLASRGLPHLFIQDNESHSSYGVIRGLHYQTGQWAQTKLVRVPDGEVLDVVIDLRLDSKTYGQHFSVILSGTNKKQLLIPKGFAHGYAVLSETAIFSYKCDQYYAREFEAGVSVNDQKIGIEWPIPNDKRIISDKDLNWPDFLQHTPV